MKKDASEKYLANALGIAPEILPYYCELVADIWNLGSWPDRIVELLRPLALPARTTRVLEPCCGKGAVSIAVARQLGFRIRGVDLYEPFVIEARACAERLGVADLCHYDISDMRDVLHASDDYDIVILAAVGNVLGDFRQTVAELRRVVHPGGYMIIDDGFLSRGSRLQRPGYEHYRPHNETLDELTAHGDVLLQEVIVPIEELKNYNQNNMGLIRKRAAALLRTHPELTRYIEQFLHAEEEECRLLEEDTLPAIWLLQRF